MATSRGEHIRLPAGDVVKNRYEVIEEIGCGNFSKVYRCYDRTKLDPKERKRFPVAMKVLKKEYKNDATFERRMLKILQDKDTENTARVSKMIEYFEWQECPVFIMPIHGPSVRSRRLGIDRGVVTRPLLLEFAYDILETLSFVHFTCRMVHTDLKPENILISDISHAHDKSFGESWVICDFGSASLWRMEKLDSDLISTRPYRAPEVVLGNRWFYAADMWSVGCILYEVAVGHRLFEVRDDNTHLQMMEKRVGRLPDSFRRSAKYSPRYFSPKGDFLIISDVVRNGRCRLTPLTDMFRSDPTFLHLLQGLLTYEPTKRLTADEALKEPVFKEIRRARNGGLDEDEEEEAALADTEGAQGAETAPEACVSPMYPRRQPPAAVLTASGTLQSADSLHLRGVKSIGEGTNLSMNQSTDYSALDEQPARKLPGVHHYGDSNSPVNHSGSSFSSSPVPAAALGNDKGGTTTAAAVPGSRGLSSQNLSRGNSAFSNPDEENTSKGNSSAGKTKSPMKSTSTTPAAATGGRRSLNSSYYKTSKPNLMGSVSSMGGTGTSGNTGVRKPPLRSLSGTAGKTTGSAGKGKTSRSSSAFSHSSAPNTPRGLNATVPARKSGSSAPATPRTPRGEGNEARPVTPRGGKIPRRESSVVAKENPPFSPKGAGEDAAARRSKGAADSTRSAGGRGSLPKPTAPFNSSSSLGSTYPMRGQPPRAPSPRESPRSPSKRPSRTPSAGGDTNSNRGTGSSKRKASSATAKEESPANGSGATVFHRQPTTPRGRASQPTSSRASRTSSVASLGAAPPLGSTAPRAPNSGRKGSKPDGGAASSLSSSTAGAASTRAGRAGRQGLLATTGGIPSEKKMVRTHSGSALRDSLRRELSNADGYKSPGTRTPRSLTPTRTSEKRGLGSSTAPSSSAAPALAKKSAQSKITPGRPASELEKSNGGAAKPATARSGPSDADPQPVADQDARVGRTKEVKEVRQAVVIDSTDQAVANAISQTPQTTAAAANRPLKSRMTLRIPASTNTTIDRKPPPAVHADKPLSSTLNANSDPLHPSSGGPGFSSSLVGASGGDPRRASVASAVVVPIIEMPPRSDADGVSEGPSEGTGGGLQSVTPLLRYPPRSLPGSPTPTDGTAVSFSAYSPRPDDYNSPERARKADSLGSPSSSAPAASTPTASSVTPSPTAVAPVTMAAVLSALSLSEHTQSPAPAPAAAPTDTAAPTARRGSSGKKGAPATVTTTRKAKSGSRSPETSVPSVAASSKAKSPGSTSPTPMGAGDGATHNVNTAAKTAPAGNGRSDTVKKSTTVVHSNPRSASHPPTPTNNEAPEVPPPAPPAPPVTSTYPYGGRKYSGGPIPPTVVTQRSNLGKEAPPPRMVVTDVSQLQSIPQPSDRRLSGNSSLRSSRVLDDVAGAPGTSTGSLPSMQSTGTSTAKTPKPQERQPQRPAINVAAAAVARDSPSTAEPAPARGAAPPAAQAGSSSRETSTKAHEEPYVVPPALSPEAATATHHSGPEPEAQPSDTTDKAAPVRERSGSLAFKEPPSNLRTPTAPAAQEHPAPAAAPAAGTNAEAPKAASPDFATHRAKYMVPSKKAEKVYAPVTTSTEAANPRSGSGEAVYAVARKSSDSHADAADPAPAPAPAATEALKEKDKEEVSPERLTAPAVSAAAPAARRRAGLLGHKGTYTSPFARPPAGGLAVRHEDPALNKGGNRTATLGDLSYAALAKDHAAFRTLKTAGSPSAAANPSSRSEPSSNTHVQVEATPTQELHTSDSGAEGTAVAGSVGVGSDARDRAVFRRDNRTLKRVPEGNGGLNNSSSGFGGSERSGSRHESSGHMSPIPPPSLGEVTGNPEADSSEMP